MVRCCQIVCHRFPANVELDVGQPSEKQRQTYEVVDRTIQRETVSEMIAAVGEAAIEEQVRQLREVHGEAEKRNAGSAELEAAMMEEQARQLGEACDKLGDGVNEGPTSA